MGTHALTTLSMDGKVSNYFRHFDGYPRVHGAELYEFLRDVKLVTLQDIGRKFLEVLNANSKDRSKVKSLSRGKVGDYEWSYLVRMVDDEFQVTVHRYSDFVFEGNMKQFKEFLIKSEAVINEPTKAPTVAEDMGNWSAPDPDVCESVGLNVRTAFFKELCNGLRNDPTVSFCGTGDRLMVAMIDDVKDGRVWATIEDCIITRRRHVILNCKDVPELTPKNAVTKISLSSALADVRNHLSKLDPQGMSYNDIAGWRNEMAEWLEELNQLTLAEPKN